MSGQESRPIGLLIGAGQNHSGPGADQGVSANAGLHREFYSQTLTEHSGEKREERLIRHF